MTSGGVATWRSWSAIACGLALASCVGSAQADGPARQGAMTVSVVRATHRCFTDRLVASGVFVARYETAVRVDRDGLVVGDVRVEPGDVVAKDQVLARLVSPKAPQDAIELKAPVAGTIIAGDVTVGAYASPGEPLLRIAADGQFDLKAETLVRNLPRLHPGMAAKLHVVGLGPVDGRVVSLADGIDAQTQLASFRLSTARNPRLRIGTFARAEIEVGQDCGLTVPLSAVLFGADGAVVATVRSDRVVMRRVTTGLLDGGDIEIRDGLAGDDMVVARAAPFLRDGDHVLPVSPAR